MISPYYEELTKAENRLTSFGYLEGLPGVEQQLFHQRSEKTISIIYWSRCRL